MTQTPAECPSGPTDAVSDFRFLSLRFVSYFLFLTSYLVFQTRLSIPLLLVLLGAAPCPAQSPASKPFRDFRRHPTEYAGPGLSDPEPQDVKEVLLGYFGPSDPAHPEGGDLWRAAQMAIDEANRQGGYQGKPFRLAPAWSENPWAAGVAQMARIVFRDKPWAIVGGIDGPSTHLAEQVVVKARLTLVSPVSTDKTVNLVNIPWMFSLAPGDHLLAPVLADAIARRTGRKPLVLASAEDHDSRLFVTELSKRLTGHRLVPVRQFEFGSQDAPWAALADRALEAKPEAVIVVAAAQPSARLVGALRSRGFSGTIYGGPWMARRRFLGEAGAAAEGAILPLVCDPQALAPAFVRAFQTRYGVEPDYAAAQTYDAVRLLVAAIGRAGLNRARIRAAVHELAPWPEVTGTIAWDPAQSNTRPALLGTIRHGRVEPLAGEG